MTIDLMDTAVQFWQVPKSPTRFWYTVTNISSPKKFLYSHLDNSWKKKRPRLHILLVSYLFILFSCSGPSLCLFLSLIPISLAFHVIFLPQSWYINKIIMFFHWLLRIGVQGFLIPWVRLCFETCTVQETLKPATGLRGKFLLSAEEDKLRFVQPVAKGDIVHLRPLIIL